MDHFIPTSDQLGILLLNIRKERGLTKAEAARVPVFQQLQPVAEFFGFILNILE